MSRIAKAPIPLPAGVEVRIDGREVEVKGAKGSLRQSLHPAVELEQAESQAEGGGPELRVRAGDESDRAAVAQAGTMRSLVNNMVIGVTQGFERRLQLVGVGYRVQAKGKGLTLALGFSHPVDYDPPEGVTVEAENNTEIVVRGSDKQRVGQAAAVIRGFRPPEPYKGKGVRYADEVVRRKEAKKK